VWPRLHGFGGLDGPGRLARPGCVHGEDFPARLPDQLSSIAAVPRIWTWPGVPSRPLGLAHQRYKTMPKQPNCVRALEEVSPLRLGPRSRRRFGTNTCTRSPDPRLVVPLEAQRSQPIHILDCCFAALRLHFQRIFDFFFSRRFALENSLWRSIFRSPIFVHRETQQNCRCFTDRRGTNIGFLD
jgi:hypothetical protein